MEKEMSLIDVFLCARSASRMLLGWTWDVCSYLSAGIIGSSWLFLSTSEILRKRMHTSQ